MKMRISSLVLTITVGWIQIASAEVPTADNWLSQSYEICEPDPSDNQKLKPVIFTPQYETKTVIPEECRTPENPEPVLIPLGDRGATIVYKTVPRVCAMRTERYVKQQFIGFQNFNDQLTDQYGRLISNKNPLKPYSVNMPELQDIVLEEIESPNDYQSRSLPKNPETCTYFEVPQRYKRFRQKLRTHVMKTGYYTCAAEGGFELSAPPTQIITRYKTKVIEPARLYLWNDKEEQIVGTRTALADYFNEMNVSGQCIWQYAK